MAINPYKSAQYQGMNSKGLQLHKQKQINRQKVKNHFVLLNIVRHFTNWYEFTDIQDSYGPIKINNQFFITRKKSTKFRLISHLDWAHYEPRDLAHAIETDTVNEYYEHQLKDTLSDPNNWADRDEEMELKTYYAERVGRASSI